MAGSTAWLGRGLSCVCAQSRESDACPSFDLTPSQLRFETEDKARRLLSNVSFLLKPGGYFFGITPEKVIAKNCCFWIC
uniref:mRNA (guanine-N(7))-methyltransferase n=1 Tax=Gossypium raimondii TaxID=29730 RepID=A0A0D2QWD3_GOSRA|nr:hypothetical protein B456_004G121800 [Gossypium raimondii]